MKRRRFVCGILAFTLSLGTAATVWAGQWEKQGEFWKFRQDNGTYAERQWIEDGGNRYYFDSMGRMLYGGSFLKDGHCYTFDDNGALLDQPGPGVQNQGFVRGTWKDQQTFTNPWANYQITIPAYQKDAKAWYSEKGWPEELCLNGLTGEFGSEFYIDYIPVGREATEADAKAALLEQLNIRLTQTRPENLTERDVAVTKGDFTWHRLRETDQTWYWDQYYRPWGNYVMHVRTMFKTGYEGSIDQILNSMKRLSE